MIKVIIAGAGFMGRTHAEAYKNIGNVNIYGIIEMDESKGKDFAEKYNCKYLQDINELAYENIDILDICLPTPYHYSTIVSGSNYVKNIICEKPITLNLDEIDHIRQLIEEKGLKFMVAHVVRFIDGYRKSKELVDAGEIGEITSIVCYRRQKPPAWSDGGWLIDSHLSGGLSFDLIIHDVDYIASILGRPNYVFGAEIKNKQGCVHVKAELIYDSCVATIFGSWGMPALYPNRFAFNHLEIIGNSGMIYYDPDKNLVHITDHEIQTVEFCPSNPYVSELHYFVHCIMNNRKPEMANIYECRLPIEITAAIVRSSQSKSIVNLLEGVTAQ